MVFASARNGVRLPSGMLFGFAGIRNQDSPRPYNSRIRRVEYPAGFEVRLGGAERQIRWNGAYVFVGRALGGEPIGLELVDEGKWLVWFLQTRSIP